jgi:hypothetical protein
MTTDKDAIQKLIDSGIKHRDIARDAVEQGYTPTVLDSSTANQGATLYACGDTYAVGTNGDSVWQEQVTGDEWAELLAEYGLAMPTDQ